MKLNEASVGKGATMPQNHLSYSGIIALISTLVCAACSSVSSPEECKIAQVRAENRRIYGENYPEEIDLYELARQVVFLERERRALLFENRNLKAEIHEREEQAREYSLLPVDIAYFRAFAQEGDTINLRSVTHEELPVFSFCTRGPRSWSEFNHHGFYYEEVPIYLPAGEYIVEVTNQEIVRFTSSRTITVSCPPIRSTIVCPNGTRVTVAPQQSTIYMLANGYRIE